MSTDPTALAREVLYAEELHDGTPANEADLREERWEFYEDLCTSQAPALVRAVIAVAALADQLDAEGDQLQHTGRLPDVPAGMERRAVAARIRAALNHTCDRTTGKELT